MPLLPRTRKRRSRHLESLHPSCGRQGNGRRSSVSSFHLSEFFSLLFLWFLSSNGNNRNLSQFSKAALSPFILPQSPPTPNPIIFPKPYPYFPTLPLIKSYSLSMHNVHHLLNLMRNVRTAIIQDSYPDFLRAYFSTRYGDDNTKFPGWAVTALRRVGVDLLG